MPSPGVGNWLDTGIGALACAGEPLEDGGEDEQQAEAETQAGQGARHQLRRQIRRQGREQIQAKGQDDGHEADVLICVDLI